MPRSSPDPWRAKLWRDLRRLRGPFVAVAVTTFLGVALFGTSYGAYRNLVASYSHLFEVTAFADLTVAGGDVESFAQAAARVPGVHAVATRTVVDTFGEVNGRRLAVRVIGMQAGEQPAVNRVVMQEGTYLSSTNATGVLVEQHLADHDGLASGDTIRLRTLLGWRDVPVLGVASSPEYVWLARSRQDVLTLPSDFAVVFAPENSLRAMALGTGRQALVLLDPSLGERREGVLERLEGLARDAHAGSITRQADQPSNAVLHEDITGFSEMAVLFPLLFLGAAALVAFVVMSRVVHGQRRLIGTLRANGVTRRALVGHHLAFGLIPAFAGGLLGAIAGEVLAQLLTGRYTEALAIPVTVVELHPLIALAGLLLAVLAVALGSLSPALDAARVAPAEAMRGALSTSRGGRTLFERLFPPLSRLPPVALMALRSAWRNPGRSAATFAGAVAALVLVFVSWGMLDSMQHVLKRQFQEAQLEDAQAYVSGDASAHLAAVAEVPGVAAAEPALVTDVTVEASDGRRYATTLTAFEPNTSMHGFIGAGDERLELRGSGVLLGANLRSKLGLNEGDPVRLALPGLDRTIETSVAGFVQEPLGTFAYLSIEAVANASPNAIFVRYLEGADREVVKAAIADVGGVLAVIDSKSLEVAANDLMGLFYVFVAAMLVFGAVLALALMYSIGGVTVAERAGELANLRANGVRMGQVARIVGGENLTLVLLSLVPGLLLAYVVASGFMASFSSDMFQIPLVVAPRTWLLACVTVLAAAVAAAIPAFRSVARIDLAGAVREFAV